MRIKAKAASLNDLMTLEPFSLCQLKKLAETAVSVPVTLEFDMNRIVGKITKAEVLEECLFVEAEITEDISGLFLVPGFLVPEYRCTMFGVTATPQDLTLNKI